MIDAKRYLKSFKAKEDKIALKRSHIQTLREKLTSISTPTDKEQVSHTKNASIMANTIAMIVDMEKEIEQESCALLSEKTKALMLLDQIPTNSANVLINRYLFGLTIDEIGKKNCSSERSAYRKIQEALKQFQRILDSQKVGSEWQ